MENKPKYKLVSFDIWQTLIKHNPAYSAARNLLFSEVLKHSDIKSVETIKSQIDRKYDDHAEMTGQDSDFNMRMTAMIEMIQKKITDYPHDFLDTTRNKLADLFANYLPSLINENTVNLFKELKKKGVKIALISNTGFAHGDTMRPALKDLGVLDYVDYSLFSNEVGFAKPHPNIYNELLKQSGLKSSEVVHIGDSVRADYLGAWKSGISSVLFDPANKYGNRMFSIADINDVLKIISGDLTILHHNNLSLYSLHMDKDRLVDQNNQSFDLVSYSKFKYGDGKIAKHYGHVLADKFIKSYPELFQSDKNEINLIITTSPYKAIVKGSSGIVKGFKNYINQYLEQIGKDAIVDITILKKEMFEGDYGSFTDKQRKELMHKNDLYIMEKFIEGKKLILIDDARITGSHEANLISFLNDKNISEAYFLYIVDMEIEFAKNHPDIENFMNHGWVDGLDKLKTIMQSPEFILNARVCKYILSQSDEKALNKFLKSLSDHVLYDLYAGIIGDGYSKMNAYVNSFKTIKQEILVRKLI